MSKVKLAYESAFGPEGMKFTNLVETTLSPVRIRQANATPLVPNGTKWLIVGNLIMGKERIRINYGDE